MYELMGYIAAGALLAIVISTMAVWICQHRQSRPSFLISIEATLLSGAIIVGYVFRGELLQWGRWLESGAKGFPLFIDVSIVALFTLPPAALASVAVVHFYRTRHDDKHDRG